MVKHTETHGAKAKFPTYKLISSQELIERKQKYVQVLKDVSVCNEIIILAREELKKLHYEKVLKNQWAQYTICDGLPRVFRPTEVRKFIENLRFQRQRIEDSTTSWTLNVNERSILTQNMLAKNMTRSALQKELRPDIGGLIATDVQKLLIVLDNIDRLLDDELQLMQIETYRQFEIINSYDDVTQEIDRALDQLIYSVISADSVYMDSADHKVATWSYNCKSYGIAIWCLRNVGIRFDEMEEPAMNVPMENLGVSIQVPFSVLSDNLTLRCIHTYYDIISKNAKSYDIFTDHGGNVSAGLVNLEDGLINDWNQQIQLQEETYESMVARQEHFNAIAQQIAEKTAQLAKAAKSADKGPKITVPKLPKEPQSLPDDMYPDTYDLFLTLNDAEYNNFIDDHFHPKSLNLTPDEINLREYIMLGGIYSIMFVRRPSHTAFENFNITLHEDGHILHTYDDITASLDSRKKSTRHMSKRLSVWMKQSRRSSVAGEPKLTPLEQTSQADSPYFIVTMKLPPHLCLWGKPVACHFEVTEEEEVPKFDIDIEDVEKLAGSLKDNNERKQSSKAQRQSTYFVDEIISDNIFRNLPIEASNNVVLSNAFRPTLFSLLRHSNPRTKKGLNEIDNYELNEIIDKIDLINLQRYGMPRIISSFKFPMEFAEDAYLSEEENKSNQKLKVRRTSQNQKESPAVKYYFDYNAQNNPERVFPHFVEYDNMYFEGGDATTIFGILGTLDDIKGRYLSRYKTIFYQKPFEVQKIKHESPAPVVQPKVKDLKPVVTVKQHKEKLAGLPSMIVDEVPVESTMEMPETLPVFFKVPERYVNASKEPETPVKTPKKVAHWTKQHIFASHFNKEEQTITITTDRLGTFGFAYKRYQHFPFRHWSIQSNPDKADEILLSLDTFCVRIILYISAKGVRGYVTNLTKEYVAKPIKYLEIVEPISDINDLRKCFLEKNINIFSQMDANFYIENGYHSIKHLPMEMHTYNAISLNCRILKFQHSGWNRLASRRNIVLNMRQNQDGADVTMRITPERTTFVEITELCSDNLDVFELQYTPTWRNIDYYSDLHMAINSMFAYANEWRNKDPSLIFQIRDLLAEIRPLSFS